MGQSVQPASARATQASALVVAQAPGGVLSDLDADHFTRSVFLETDQLSDRQEARVAPQPEDAFSVFSLGCGRKRAWGTRNLTTVLKSYGRASAATIQLNRTDSLRLQGLHETTSRWPASRTLLGQDGRVEPGDAPQVPQQQGNPETPHGLRANRPSPITSMLSMWTGFTVGTVVAAEVGLVCRRRVALSPAFMHTLLSAQGKSRRVGP